MSVFAQISCLLLGAGGWRGPLVFFSKMVFFRLPTLMDLAIDEFQNAPLEIFIGCSTHVDF